MDFAYAHPYAMLQYMSQQEIEEFGNNCIDILSLVYDDYIDKDEFPLDVSKLYFDYDPEYDSENDIVILYNKKRHDFFYRETKYSLIDDFKIEIIKESMYFKRVSKVIVNKLVGSFAFKTKINFPDDVSFMTATAENIRDVFVEFFEEFYQAKSGVGAEIITATCKRMILIDSLSRETGIFIYGYDEDKKLIDAFEISLDRVDWRIVIDRYEIQYILISLSIAKVFSDNFYFDLDGDKSTTPEELKKYSEFSAKELSDIFKRNTSRGFSREEDRGFLSKVYKVLVK